MFSIHKPTETNGRMSPSREQVDAVITGAITLALTKIRHKITVDQVVIYRAPKAEDNALAQLVDALVGTIAPLLLNAAQANPARGLATFAHELFVHGEQLDAAAVDVVLASAATVANARCAELARDGRLAHYATRFSVQVHPKVAIYLEALSKEFGASLGTLSSEMLNRAVYRMHPTIAHLTQTNQSSPANMEKPAVSV